MTLGSHTRNETRSPEKNAFLDSSQMTRVTSVTDVKVHTGIGRVRNMKVCVVVSKSRL